MSLDEGGGGESGGRERGGISLSGELGGCGMRDDRTGDAGGDDAGGETTGSACARAVTMTGEAGRGKMGAVCAKSGGDRGCVPRNETLGVGSGVGAKGKGGRDCAKSTGGARMVDACGAFEGEVATMGAV